MRQPLNFEEEIEQQINPVSMTKAQLQAQIAKIDAQEKAQAKDPMDKYISMLNSFILLMIAAGIWSIWFWFAMIKK